MAIIFGCVCATPFGFENFLVQVEGTAFPFHFAGEGQKLTNKLGRPFAGFLNLHQLLPTGVVTDLPQSSNWAYPVITCSRLLKSWAMPPARVPMASIF